MKRKKINIYKGRVVYEGRKIRDWKEEKKERQKKCKKKKDMMV